MAFESLKKHTMIKVFDPKKEVSLTVVANEHGGVEIISQKGHPVIYLSRK